MYYRIACLLAIMLSLLPMSAYADEHRELSRRIVVGAHLGLDLATIGGAELDDPGVDYSYRAGFTGGIVTSFHATPIIAGQIEINVASKGFRADTDFPSTSGTQREAYLEIPLLVQARVPISEDLRLHASFGPALAVLLDADIRFDDGQFDERERGRERLDIGLMVGAGATLDLGEVGELAIDARFNLGLRNRNENPAVSESLNRAIYVTVGYRADLATLGRLLGGSR